jgi:photosystem II stability/assembly factor-like uncharacterized protein
MKRKLFLIVCLSFLLLSTSRAQWHRVASFTNIRLYDVCFISNYIGFVTGGDCDNPLVLKTVDAGLTWDTIGEQIQGFIVSINFINDTTGFITSSKNLDSWIYKTDDQGETWEIVNQQTLTSCTVSFPTDSIGYSIQSVAAYTFVSKTTDCGATWGVINSFMTNMGSPSVIDYQFTTDDIGYLVYETGEVFKTNDGGMNFEEVFQDQQYLFRSMFFLNSDIGYVVGTKDACANPLTDKCGIVAKTINGGTSWVLIPVSGRCNDVIFINPDTGFIASEDYMIHTFNAGITWQISNGAISYNMYSVDFPGQSVGYAIGNILQNYSGLYKFSLYDHIGSTNPENDKITLFPNPADNYVIISMKDKLPVEKLTILNLTGEIVIQLEPANERIDVSLLTPGIYILGTETSQRISRNKLIIE